MSRLHEHKVRKTRIERKTEIRRILYFWGYHDGLTMTQISYWLRIRPSTHLMGILKEMQGVGTLKALEETWRPNSIRYVWSLTSKGNREAKVQRDAMGWQE